jgi:hypothetical protein
MANAIPSVNITEVSIKSNVVNEATGVVAYVLECEKGRLDDFIDIATDKEFIDTCGAPTTTTLAQHYEICKSFLSYGNQLKIRRVVNEDTAKLGRIGIIGANQSQSGWSGDAINQTGNEIFFKTSVEHTVDTGFDLEFFAQSPYDNIDLQIAMCKPVVSNWAADVQTYDGTNKFSDVFEFGPDSSKKEVAIMVFDGDGNILEQFIVSLEEGYKNSFNENEYITDYLNAKSSYIWGYAETGAYDNIETFEQISLLDGARGDSPTLLEVTNAYAEFINKDAVTFDYILDGMNYLNRTQIINDIVEIRKDSVAIIGCKYTDIFNGTIPISSNTTIKENIITDISALPYSSWAVYYANWHEKYNVYLDKRIWVPIVGDIAGNKVNLNTNAYEWTPNAGTNNAILRTVSKIAWNPTESQQNDLYKYAANVVISKRGKGICPWTQKTMTNENIGVSRWNIRELFRKIEINIGSIAEDYIHEFNDSISRNNFIARCTPILDDMVQKRGIVDYLIQDLTTDNDVDNYTALFVFYIKGNKPIENMTLKFYDTPVGISFDEVIG